MKKRILAMLLALCMSLSLGAIALAEGEELEEPEGLPDGMWEEMSDEQKAKYEEYLEFKEAKDGQSGEAGEAGTAEVPADVWNAVGTVPAMAYSAGQSLTSAPEEMGMTLEDESLNALAGAVGAALREWVLAEGDDSFEALWGSLTDGRTFSQFVTEYAAFRPAKGAEDPIFDEDTQEIMSCMARSISEGYLVPNGIGGADFAWPADQAAWDYYNTLLDSIYDEIAIGADNPVDGSLAPASPDKEIMDAAAQGVADWLYAFESVASAYLDHLYPLLKDAQYIMDNVTVA